MADNNETAPRNYVVLEFVETEIYRGTEALENDEQREQWAVIDRLAARNSEHAKKLVFIKHYGEDSERRPVLVAVPERNWQPEPVGNKIRRSVAVG